MTKPAGVLADLERVVAAVRSHSYTFTDEDELQRGIENALDAKGVCLSREFRLDRASRIDFLCGRVGVEVKVRGPVDALIRQCDRYTQTGKLDSLLIVTTKAQHAALDGRTSNGCPVRVVTVFGL